MPKTLRVVKTQLVLRCLKLPLYLNMPMKESEHHWKAGKTVLIKKFLMLTFLTSSSLILFIHSCLDIFFDLIKLSPYLFLQLDFQSTFSSPICFPSALASTSWTRCWRICGNSGDLKKISQWGSLSFSINVAHHPLYNSMWKQWQFKVAARCRQTWSQLCFKSK